MKNFSKKLKTIWWSFKLFLAQIYYGNPARKLKIIGVTGTNGKTTTATLLYKIALELGYKAGLIGTVENRANREKIEIKSNSSKPGTTPDSTTLIKIFNEMVKKDCEYVFMEVSSHAMDQNRVRGIKFTGGIFTNLTHDHLDYHKTMEQYFLAKKAFFKFLPKDAFALSNADDPYGARMLDGINAKKETYGFKGQPARNASGIADAGGEDFHGEIVNMDFSGLKLKINDHGISAPLIGKFNAYNVLAVYSACLLLGFNKEKTTNALAKVSPPAGRFEYFYGANGVLGVLDFAHSPDAVEKIINTAKDIVKEGGRVISVFGCGGDKDPFKRPVMGKLGASLSDLAIFTADNPRSEEPEKIIEAMCSELSPELLQKIKKFPDRNRAIEEVGKIARAGDIVLLMGKGPETYQEIKGVKYPWSDMEKLKAALS